MQLTRLPEGESSVHLGSSRPKVKQLFLDTLSETYSQGLLYPLNIFSVIYIFIKFNLFIQLLVLAILHINP
jgi:hypothetical protein